MASKKSKSASKAKTATQSKTKSKARPKAKTRTGADDIVKLILQDHMPLKKLIKIMKSEAPIAKRAQAFAEFAPLLLAHATSEEKALYTFMKKNEELREEAFEGDVEHGLADQMVEEAKRSDDEDLMSARIKVLAELVEHHIKEEEDEMLPDFKKESSAEERELLGRRYIELKTQFEAEGSDNAPSERSADNSARA